MANLQVDGPQMRLVWVEGGAGGGGMGYASAGPAFAGLCCTQGTKPGLHQRTVLINPLQEQQHRVRMHEPILCVPCTSCRGSAQCRALAWAHCIA